jgi:hypothetical protein
MKEKENLTPFLILFLFRTNVKLKPKLTLTNARRMRVINMVGPNAKAILQRLKSVVELFGKHSVVIRDQLLLLSRVQRLKCKLWYYLSFMWLKVWRKAYAKIGRERITFAKFANHNFWLKLKIVFELI